MPILANLKLRVPVAKALRERLTDGFSQTLMGDSQSVFALEMTES